MKLISDRLLRQRNGLMIYNKIERVLVIIKQIFNYYNTNFSLEITSKVQKDNQKYTFTHKPTTKATFRQPSLFLAQPSRNGTHRIVGYQRQRRIHLCCLQKSIRWRYLMRQEVKITLDSDVPWCLPTLEGVLRRQHFFSFRMQPKWLSARDLTATAHFSAWASALQTAYLAHEISRMRANQWERVTILMSHSNRAEARKLRRIRSPGSFRNWRRFTENYCRLAKKIILRTFYVLFKL